MRTFFDVCYQKAKKSPSRQGSKLSPWESGHAIPFSPQDFGSPCEFVRCLHNIWTLLDRVCINSGSASLFVVLRHCLLGRAQRGKSVACLLISRALFNGLSCETGSFSYCDSHCNPQPSLSPLKSAPSLKPASLVACPALKVCCIPSVFLSLPVRSASLLVWSFWLIFSLIPLLLEFHEVWFSGALVVYWFQIGCYPPFGCVRK